MPESCRSVKKSLVLRWRAGSIRMCRVININDHAVRLNANRALATIMPINEDDIFNVEPVTDSHDDLDTGTDATDEQPTDLDVPTDDKIPIDERCGFCKKWA